MSSQPPLIMVDNVFDRINLYALASLAPTNMATIAGREINYIADYRRERTYAQASSASANVGPIVDMGVGNTAVVDSIWIDRGHNLWGKTVYVDGSTDGASWSNPNIIIAMVVPALGTVGGDPTTGWCVTEEGAIYTLAVNATARRFWRLYVSDVWQSIITGLVMGKRVQLSSPAGYSSIVDEDAGDRNEVVEQSRVPGYEGIDRMYSARKVELRLAYIGATEYDAAIRGLRRTLFDVGQPAVVCMNYGTYPERAWLYRYKGTSWSSPIAKGSYRNATITLQEYGPLIR